jgi:hypothetical protein
MAIRGDPWSGCGLGVTPYRLWISSLFFLCFLFEEAFLLFWVICIVDDQFSVRFNEKS